ncbi:hypothetical protein ABID56_001797 [Alkalibacillus flavidus]|uniref:Uncharacterized protein n=1 Tax=Alkalibacillus flavidus TaxID=546021 RepID=A0ABV2KVS5_9BACI
MFHNMTLPKLESSHVTEVREKEIFHIDVELPLE